MKRTGWKKSLLASTALGLFGATAWGDEITWTSADGKLTKVESMPVDMITKANEPKFVQKPVEPRKLVAFTAEKLKSPDSTDIWKSSTGVTPAEVTPIATPADPSWKSTGPLTNAAITPSPIAAPVLTDDGVWKASTGHAGVMPAALQVPSPEVITAPAPAPKLTDPVPSPLVPPIQLPKSAETKPIESKPLPLPKTKLTAPPTAVAPLAFAPTPSLPASDSTSVWGGYSPAGTKSFGGGVTTLPGTTVNCTTGECVPPNRHGTFGSPALKLSRDYSLLDAVSHPVTGEERVIIEDAPAVQSDYYVAAEYLVWWMNAGNIPVLATTAASRMFGYIGEPGTTLLLGPGTFGTTARQGLRLRGGVWLDDCQECGVDASFFYLGSRTTEISFDSGNFPTIARPFFAPNFNREFSELVAFPGLSAGRLNVSLNSFIWGADVNYRRGITNDCNRTCEWFVGFRHVTLKEDLTITENLIAQQNAPDPAGTTIVVRDRFNVTNSFNGGQVGTALSRRWGNYSISARGSVALGNNHEELEIIGSQVRTRPGEQPVTFTGGLLAVGPNLGTFTRDRFSVLPEATVNVGYNVRPNVKVYVGYNFMALSNVIRPGDQIDRVVDLSFIPNAPTVAYSGMARPQPLFKQSDLVIQGIQFGVEGSW